MSLWEMSLSGAVMILAIAAVRAATINRLPKKVFILLWEAVLLRLLVPFSIPSVLSAYSFARKNMPAREALVESPAGGMIPQAALGQIDINAEEMEVLSGSGAPGFSIWSALWTAGVVLCAAFFIISYLRCYLEFKTSLPVHNEFAVNWLEEHRIKRSVQIRQSDRISAPLTYGLIHPVILMPKKTNWENSRQLQYILLHEYVHICRFDMVRKLIAAFALCIHWFNPFVWGMYVLFNRDIELLCDASVVRQSGEDSKAAYARALISMEEQKSGLTPLCNNFSKNAIEERITAIMKTKKITIGALIVSAAILITIVVLFATSAEKEMPSNHVDKTVAAEESVVPDEGMGAEKPPVGQKSADVRENTIVIQCVLEGMLEEMPATVYAGDGFSIYIPDEGWQIYDETLEAPAQMAAVYSSEVSIWVEHYAEKPADVEARLLSEGYTYDAEGRKMQKLDQMLLLEDRIVGLENDTWVIGSMYPAAYEWGARLDAIADTFARTTDTEEDSLETEQEAASLKSSEEAVLRHIMVSFCTAYFAGDIDGMKQYLAESYEGNIKIYDNLEIADGIDIREIKGIDNVSAGMGAECTLWLEFLVPEEDSLTYLTVEFIKENGRWKIRGYGLEK